MWKHFGLWYAPDNTSGFTYPVVCQRRLTTWSQVDGTDSIWNAISLYSLSWGREHWSGSVASIKTPAPTTVFQADARQRLHLMWQTTTPGPPYLAHIYVPAPNDFTTAGDDVTSPAANYSSEFPHILGVLADAYGGTVNSYDAVGDYIYGLPLWPLPQSASLRRRTTLWVDAHGRSVLDHFLHVDDIASGDLLLDCTAQSRADYLWTISGALELNNAAPASETPYSPTDQAVLSFASAAGATKFTIPAPTPAMFLADQQTVNDAYISSLVSTILANGLSYTGLPLLSYTGGRRHKARLIVQ